MPRTRENRGMAFREGRDEFTTGRPETNRLRYEKGLRTAREKPCPRLCRRVNGRKHDTADAFLT